MSEEIPRAHIHLVVFKLRKVFAAGRSETVKGNVLGEQLRQFAEAGLSTRVRPDVMEANCCGGRLIQNNLMLNMGKMGIIVLALGFQQARELVFHQLRMH